MSEKTLIVQQGMLTEGFMVQGRGGVIIRLPFQVIRQLPDGNYLVKEPSPDHPDIIARGWSRRDIGAD